IIISGGIDLSTASAAAVTGMTYGLLLQIGWNATGAIVGTLVVGLVLGLLNGVLVAYVRVSFLVVTLGTLSIFESIALVVAGVTLRHTTFGRSVYAVGANSEAARLTGINLMRTTLSVYVLAGLAAGVASLIQVGRLTGASPGVDSTLLLTVIAAALIGGTAY